MSDKCPLCDERQTNKHVLSNCGSSNALDRYTDRHNMILTIIVEWLKCNLPADLDLYCDLHMAGSRQVSDLFLGLRPDIAVKSVSKVTVLELTICHETNMIASRNYKINKYSQINKHKSDMLKNIPVTVYSCEISTLGFIHMDNLFIKDCNLPPLDNQLALRITQTAIRASFDIYNKRNL